MKITNILCINPPSVPSYFNAGHILPLFQVASYLESKGFCVDVYDMGSLNRTWRDVCNVLSKKDYQLIVIFNDYDLIDGFARFIDYSNEFQPYSKLITFGRLSHQIPGFFKKFDLDAIVFSGDYESSVFSYVKYLSGNSEHPGVQIKLENNKWQKGEKGYFLTPEEWCFPDPSRIPYQDYSRLYQDDSKRFCGIPQRKELVVNVARGCPVGCEYCEVPRNQGKNERRISVESALKYIESNFDKHDFEYVSFYAPTFTLNKKWVFDFCSSYIAQGMKFKWKCVTTLYHLDEELIKLMGQAGCIRISIGIETMVNDKYEKLPKLKRKSQELVSRLSFLMDENNIEFNAFVMLGLPGEEIKDVEYTFNELKKLNVRVRPTLFTPYHQMNENMDIHEVRSYNRQIFAKDLVDDQSKKKLFEICYKSSFKNTNVFKNIPAK